MLISREVKKYCRELLTVKTGKAAVETCRNNPDIDLILMDIKMPGMDGYEATREIRKFNQNVFIIAQTAFALSGDRDKSFEAGCDEYISKPINNVVLKSLIEEHFLEQRSFWYLNKAVYSASKLTPGQYLNYLLNNQNFRPSSELKNTFIFLNQ
jgi:CheY-like chemotaxis protein